MKTKNFVIGGLAGLGVYTAYKFMLRKQNNPETIKKVIQNWLDTVCKHNPQAIVDLYAPDGVLLGTVAKTMKVGRNEIIGYFNMFVEKQPCGIFKQVNIQNFGSDYAVADGTYDFNLLNDEGEKDVVAARFTFVLRKIKGVWKIAAHHSSVNPE
jgi:uncharacterized protein (TIGR02246 family)|tara:strand:- start:783 stop:1244 length:462 start_codon:yes stop_codon:yes gene_type:complete